MKNKQETEIAIWILRMDDKDLLIKMGFCDILLWSLNTNEVREIAAMTNF